MIRWRPLTDPHWGDPILTRVARRCGFAGVVTWLVVLAVLFAATRRPLDEPAIHVLAVVACVVVSAAVSLLLVRRTIAPLFEAIGWSLAAARRRWAALGVADGVGDPSAALDALGERSDDEALIARSALLAGAGRTVELDALLASWEPVSPAGVAARARHRVALAEMRGERADRSEAIVAASALPDPGQRTNALALLHIDAARREAQEGRSPESELRLARHELAIGGSDVPVPAAAVPVGQVSFWLTVVASAVPIAVSAVVVGGVLWLAVWVAAVALFVIGARVMVARRGPWEPNR